MRRGWRDWAEISNPIDQFSAVTLGLDEVWRRGWKGESGASAFQPSDPSPGEIWRVWIRGRFRPGKNREAQVSLSSDGKVVKFDWK